MHGSRKFPKGGGLRNSFLVILLWNSKNFEFSRGGVTLPLYLHMLILVYQGLKIFFLGGIIFSMVQINKICSSWNNYPTSQRLWSHKTLKGIARMIQKWGNQALLKYCCRICFQEFNFKNKIIVKYSHKQSSTFNL